MFRISPAQPALHLSATAALPSSESVCHRLVRLIDDEIPRQSFHDREFLIRTFLQLSGTGMPGWYYTPDFADGSRLTLDMSIAGQITVTAYGPGMASEREILTPVHPLWEVISNAPAQAKLIREWRDWAAIPAPGEKREEALRRVTDYVVQGARDLMPDLYYTPDFPDGRQLTLDISIAGQITVTAYGPGMASEREILTPVHPQWEVIINAPAQARLIRKWRDWAAMPAPGEKREEALRRVMDCVVQGAKDLTLINLGLTSLPDLPSTLTRLDVRDNKLTALPALSGSLKTLNANNNQLAALPDLPSTLKRLDASNNKLTALPDLPGSLTTLDASINRLTALPDLPNSLTELGVSNNRLTALPDLPGSLKELRAGGNQLIALPDLPIILKWLSVWNNELVTLPALPNSLTALDANSNRLTALPALPDSLTTLDASSNRLTALPDLPNSLTALYASNSQLTALPDLPNSLTALYASHNQLTALPDLPGSLTRLCASNNQLTALPALPDSLAQLDIARNWLTTLPPLPALLEWQDIGFSNQRGVRQSLPLPDSITRWYPPQRQESVRTTWTPLATEENAEPFTKFLNQLNENTCAHSPVFRKNVAAWLDELLTTPELRTLSFAMAQEASTSCTDRAALGWNNMQVARLLFHADRNEQTTGSEIITLARQVFRLRQLEHIAGSKVRSLSAASARIDEIEVYLAYQTRLKEALCLPDILTSAMNFGSLAAVTERDIHMAAEEVIQVEEHEFRSWLNNWEPCQQFLLKRMAADEQDALTEQRIAVFEEQLQHFREEFSDAGSGTDVDRVLGVRATEATNDIIFGPLTGKMF